MGPKITSDHCLTVLAVSFIAFHIIAAIIICIGMAFFIRCAFDLFKGKR